MTVTLGIHVGHDAACAAVVDGRLVSAVAQERVTRRKHDGDEMLSSRLPIIRCLDNAGLTLDLVDVIVSSWQSASPGGFGLHRPFLDPDFDLFDPFDARHVVASHHLAHAWSTYGCSGLRNTAILVCDLAGSTTLDGRDYVQPFTVWAASMTSIRASADMVTECLSIYQAENDRLDLVDRDFCVASNAPRTFVFSVASLYENVSHRIFGGTDAHGQVMALASSAEEGYGVVQPCDIATITGTSVAFHNDWQHRVPWKADDEELAALAAACQSATEDTLLAYARRTAKLTKLPALCVAGGSFLNIPSNSRIAQSGVFDDYFVPSAPHDSGIAIGCAFLGDSQKTRQSRRRQRSPTDRLGSKPTPQEIDAALDGVNLLVRSRAVEVGDLAARLGAGAIVARFSGRAEFGPRALGGRSLLASPFDAVTKDRLNQIKGRQRWRPVAPVVRAADAAAYFDGPASPYMSFTHQIRPEWRGRLRALEHPDDTTRAQTLPQGEDPFLEALLTEFGRRTGASVLVNTSFNGKGEPIVETVERAIEFFLASPDVDVLVLGDRLVERAGAWTDGRWPDVNLSLRTGALVHLAIAADRAWVTYKSVTVDVPSAVVPLLIALQGSPPVRRLRDGYADIGPALWSHVYRLIELGIIGVTTTAEVGARCATGDSNIVV